MKINTLTHQHIHNASTGKSSPPTRQDSMVSPNGLTKNQKYHELLENYQLGEFEICENILEHLEQIYPGHQELIRIKDELALKQVFKSISTQNMKVQKTKKKKKGLHLAFFAIFGAMIMITAFFVSYKNLFVNVTVRQMKNEASQLAAFHQQAEQLLLIGQPQPAAEIIENMAAINPEYSHLPELISTTEQMLKLESQYQAALVLIETNMFDQALDVLRTIENEMPGLWDVQLHINALEDSK